MKKFLRILILLVAAFFVIKTQTTRLNSPVMTDPSIVSIDPELTDCVSYFDGCNTCMVVDGAIAGCTKIFCREKGEPKCLAYQSDKEDLDLTNCVSYFDGCNNCSVENGKPSACTLMYCETPSEPRCLQYVVDNTGMWLDNLGVGILEIQDYHLQFVIPNNRSVDRQPNRIDTRISLRLATPYQDTQGYQVFVDVTITEDPSYLQQIQKSNADAPLTDGQTMKVDCDGVTPSSCMAIYASGKAYLLGASAKTLQPQDPNTPSTIVMQDYNQVLESIQKFLLGVRISK